jgi:uncharacterized protein DUF6894
MISTPGGVSTSTQDTDMSRYFFNLAGEHAVDDPDGMELADVASARLHAVELAQALMRRSKLFREYPDRWSVRLTDAEGSEVAVISFSEAAMLSAGSEPENERAAFSGRLGWKVQLHLGKEMATADREILDRELPERLRDLLVRLEKAPRSDEP